MANISKLVAVANSECSSIRPAEFEGITGMPLKAHDGFDQIPQRYREDLLKIEGFLTRPEEVKAELNFLDTRLSAEPRGTPEQKLWREFQSMEQRGQFTPKIAIVTKELPPRRFVMALQRGFPLKDIGVGGEHGEYSHRLQWYLIMQRYYQIGSRRLTLNYAPCVLYRFLGLDSFLRPEDPRTLWAAVVDTFEPDASSPEWLNMNVCGFDNGATSANWELTTLRRAFKDRYERRERDEYVATDFEGFPRPGTEDVSDIYTRELTEGDTERVQTASAGPSRDWVPWPEVTI